MASKKHTGIDAYMKITIRALIEEDWPAIHCLLDTGKLDPNAEIPGSIPGDCQGTLLTSVMERCETPLVLKLLEMGADVNRRGPLTYPLTLAVDKRLHEVIEALLQKGARVNQKSANGITPLLWACAQGDAWAVKRLLAAGGDPMVRSTKHKLNGIYHAMAPTSELVERLEIARLMHDAGCRCDGYEIHAPVKNREVEKVKLLIELGCPVNLPIPFNDHRRVSRKGETPLTLVAEHQAGDPYPIEASPRNPERMAQRLEIMKLLLKAGADPEVANRKGHTPLYVLDDCVGMSRKDEEFVAPMVQLLIQAGAKRMPETEEHRKRRERYAPMKALWDQGIPWSEANDIWVAQLEAAKKAKAAEQASAKKTSGSKPKAKSKK